MPGPAVLCSMAQSSRYGFRPSLAGIAGIQAGNFLFFVCVALGLGALLAAATATFSVLRVVGAIYLFYLGGRIIFLTLRDAGAKPIQPAAVMPAHRSLFFQGLLVQVTNPKALLFVSALLPQFIKPHRPAAPQLAILVLTTILVDSTVLSSYAFVAQRGLRSFRKSRYSTRLEQALGAVLLLFGLRLLLSRK